VSDSGFPVIIGPEGPQPTPPATINAELIATVAASDPGYTVLPGGLIEDFSSTATGALVETDSYRVETINSLTPLGSNAFLTTQLGAIYGVPIGAATNTSVYVVFHGTVGFPIAQSFVVSDGIYQYVIQDGGIIGGDGYSLPLYAVAVQSGSWAIAAGTVTILVTGVPSTITLSVTNPSPGTPATSAQTPEDYRASVLQAGYAPSQGMATYLKTLLGNVPGVQRNLIAVKQVSTGYEIICGGGDPYQIGYAIFMADFYLPGLVGSTISITGITQATLGVVTTNLNHGLATGQANVYIAGVVGMTGANGGPYTVTVITEKTFTFGVNTSGFGAYVSGGVVTPNSRNITVAINDYPDTYTIPFVNPPEQTVLLTATWNTTATYSVSADAVAQLVLQPLTDYINGIFVGAPINILSLESVFRAAIASVLPPELLTRIVFEVTINGVVTNPTSGTVIVPGDPESYFFTQPSNITVIQG
jgi:hypothetical protein